MWRASGLRTYFAKAVVARVPVRAAGRVALAAGAKGKIPESKGATVTPAACETLLTPTLTCTGT